MKRHQGKVLNGAENAVLGSGCPAPADARPACLVGMRFLIWRKALSELALGIEPQWLADARINITTGFSFPVATVKKAQKPLVLHYICWTWLATNAKIAL